MSHSHNGGCHDDSHHHHDLDLIPNNLFNRIDHDNVIALNASPLTPPGKVFKPWHDRMDETIYLESDDDDQLILRVPFTGVVKIRAILIKAGPEDQTPAQMALFPNDDSVDFSDVSDKIPAQNFSLARSREVGEYALKVSKFSNTSSLAIFFPSSYGADSIRIYYVGFLGEWHEFAKEPTSTIVYESNARPADHEKIPGTEKGFSTTRL